MPANLEDLAEKVERVRLLGAPLTQGDIQVLIDFRDHLRELETRNHGIAVFVACIIEWLVALGHLKYALEFARSVPDDDFAMLDDALSGWGKNHEIFNVLALQDFIEKGMIASAVREAETINSNAWKVYAYSALSLYFGSIEDHLGASRSTVAALEALDSIRENEVRHLVGYFIPVPRTCEN
jgi:hypothetical protein